MAYTSSLPRNKLLNSARKVRLVDDDEGKLSVLIKASVPLIYVYSFEEERVLSAVQSIARSLGEERRRARKVYVWSASQGLRNEAGELTRSDTLADPTAAILHAIENPEDAIYVFLRPPGAIFQSGFFGAATANVYWAWGVRKPLPVMNSSISK